MISCCSEAGVSCCHTDDASNPVVDASDWSREDDASGRQYAADIRKEQQVAKGTGFVVELEGTEGWDGRWMMTDAHVLPNQSAADRAKVTPLDANL